MAETATQAPEFTRGDYFRRARLDAGFGSGDMAAMLGVTRNTISNVESDRVRPRRVVVLAWAAATGVPVEWLERGMDAPSSQSEGLGFESLRAHHSQAA